MAGRKSGTAKAKAAAPAPPPPVDDMERARSLVGRALDVPNELWEGCGDGGVTVGEITRADRVHGGAACIMIYRPCGTELDARYRCRRPP